MVKVSNIILSKPGRCDFGDFWPRLGFYHKSVKPALTDHYFPKSNCVNFILDSKMWKHLEKKIGLNQMFWQVKT